MYITLEEAKVHLIVQHDEDDAYILDLIETAEAELETMIKRPFSEVLNDGGRLPATLRHALKILVAKLYAYREGDTLGRGAEAPFTLANLIIPYRKES